MSASMRRRVLLVALLPLPIVIAVCVLFAWQIARLNEAAGWVNHTNEVLSDLHLAERLLIDQETAIRGFLLTRDAPFLAPYQEGRTRLPRVLDRLRSLTSDNPAQQNRIAEWRSRYHQWLSDAERDTNLATIGQPRAELLARKASMDRMRAITGQMAAEERRLLAERQAGARDQRRATILSVLASLIIVGVFLVWLMFRSAKDIEVAFTAALDGERRARAAAEALAREISEQSEQMQHLYKQVRDERDSARQRLTELGKAD